MLIKEYERIDPGHVGTKIIVNLEAIDLLSDYQPKAASGPVPDTCTLVLRCGMVLAVKAKKASIEQAMKNYRG